ncbi:MAG: T9SS type A sorting domain-containing protein [Cyclonatronaceae bacterium]
MIIPPADPDLRFTENETLAGDEPDPALIRSTGTGGSWDDPATWDAGRVPARNDTVLISTGTLVTLSGNEQRRAGRLVVEESAELRGLNNARLAVYHNLLNNGEITHIFEDDQFFVGVLGLIENNGTIATTETLTDVQLIEMELYGNIINRGTWKGIVETFGENPRTIDLRSSEVILLGRAPDLELIGDNYIPVPFSFDDTARLIVTNNARLYSNYFASLILEVFDYMDNRGQVIAEDEDFGITGYGMNILAEDEIHARIISYGKQVPASFALANRRWFRFEPVDGPDEVTIRQITFEFTVGEMGSDIPEALEVFYSADGGASWIQISDQNNTTRDIFGLEVFGLGSVTIVNPPGYGDYVLSTGDPYSIRPSVGMYINTAPQIRVGGPPHEATLTYYNAGSSPTSDALIEINTGGGVYIDEIIPLGKNGAPVNDIRMGIDDFAFDRDSTEALLYAPPLGPGEVRRIRLVLQAVPTGIIVGGGDEIAAVPLGFLAGTVVVGLFKDYIKDIVLNGMEEVIADPCSDRSSFQDKMRTAFDKTDAQWNPFGSSEAPYLSVANNAGDALTDGSFKNIKGGMSKAGVVSHVHDVGKAVSNGFDRYEQNSGRSIYQPIDCDPDEPLPPFPQPDRRGANRDLEPVFSWDPNQKVGPIGGGTGEYLAETGRFYYRIDFENLEEATAPAYRVVITDTLSAVFDPETVVLEGESHPGFEFTRTGNILRWEIVGIELVPNVNPPEGEGWVAFSVDAYPGQESGTVFENRATIVFDLNPPIMTNTHINILDNLPPVTVMEALPERVVTDTLIIHFNSDDRFNGSGVDNVVVFGSRNGGGFTQVGISDTSFARIPVRDGSWSFYALASDKVGNAEFIQPSLVTTEVVTPTSIDDSGEHPLTWSLGANYPNPFNPVTIIPYTMQQGGEVSITLYDVLGRRVMLLKPGYRDMGRYHQELDMRRLASGTYLYELRVNGTDGLLFRSTGKMMFVK